MDVQILDRAERLKISLNLTYMMVDIAVAYAFEVESLLKANKLYKHQDKKVINQTKTLLGGLIKSVDRSLKNPETQLNFGDDCDFIRSVIELAILTKDEKKQKSLLNAMKRTMKIPKT